jgi:hypothetical protein
MADESVGPGAGPFNRSASIAAVYAQDAAFWALHEQWREAEDAFESGPYAGDEPEGELLADRASDLRDAMFIESISTATALAAKLEAMADGDNLAGMIEMELPGGLSIFEALQRDCQRLADAEAGVCGGKQD